MNSATLFSVLAGLAFKSTAVLAAAWLVTILLRGRSAAARHIVWTSAAAALIALPILSIAVPAMHVPLGSMLAATVDFQTTSAAKTDANAAPVALGMNPVAPLKPRPRRPDWKTGLTVLWALGTAAILLKTLTAYAAIWRVRRSAKPFADRDLIVELAGELGIRHAVDVLSTRPGAMPMAFGVLRPAVLMPADACEWSEDRTRVVLLHELAHVRRGDMATHLLSRIALSLYWWNPLAWTAWRLALKERERAADDLVLNAGARASEYAGHLLEVARGMQSASLIGWAAVAMARTSQLEGRLSAILDSNTNRQSPGRAAALVAVLVAVGIVAPLAALRAQEVQPQSASADLKAAIDSAASQKNPAILETVAQAAERQRDFETASRALNSALAIRAEVSGPRSVEYGLALLKLGDLDSKRHLNQSAADFYTRAAEVLGDRPEASQALLALGTATIMKNDLPQALQYFEHAQRVDPTHAGRALMWMGVVRGRQGNPEEAEKLFQASLSAEDPRSTDAVVTSKVYAQFLRLQERADEAKGIDARANGVQKEIALSPGQYVIDRSGVYRIGEGITTPKLLQKIEPEYSDAARAAKYSGTVILAVEIGPDGLAHNIQVRRSLGLGLDEKGIEAITQWRFQPGVKDGQPVTVAANVEINFKLL